MSIVNRDHPTPESNRQALFFKKRSRPILKRAERIKRHQKTQRVYITRATITLPSIIVGGSGIEPELRPPKGSISSLKRAFYLSGAAYENRTRALTLATLRATCYTNAAYGGAEGTRTPNLLRARQALSQIELQPLGLGEWIRTTNPWLPKPVPFQIRLHPVENRWCRDGFEPP